MAVSDAVARRCDGGYKEDRVHTFVCGQLRAVCGIIAYKVDGTLL